MINDETDIRTTKKIELKEREKQEMKEMKEKKGNNKDELSDEDEEDRLSDEDEEDWLKYEDETKELKTRGKRERDAKNQETNINRKREYESIKR